VARKGESATIQTPNLHQTESTASSVIDENLIKTANILRKGKSQLLPGNFFLLRSLGAILQSKTFMNSRVFSLPERFNGFASHTAGSDRYDCSTVSLPVELFANY